MTKDLNEPINMNLTNLEQNVVLVSLDHMEEHLFIVYEAGDITEDTYNLRIHNLNTARTKIKQINEPN